MAMDVDELIAREAIRDLVARYNANGDSGRFVQVMELFAPDSVMEIIGDRVYTGHDEILSIFTGTADRLTDAADGEGSGSTATASPKRVRHFVGTHQIDLVDADHARGRAYVQVLTDIGLDHWGLYVDEYVRRDGRWFIGRRTVTIDGYAPNSYLS